MRKQHGRSTEHVEGWIVQKVENTGSIDISIPGYKEGIRNEDYSFLPYLTTWAAKNVCLDPDLKREPEVPYVISILWIVSWMSDFIAATFGLKEEVYF